MKGPFMDLTTEQRSNLLGKIEKIVSEKYFDPAFDESIWQAIVSRHRSSIVGACNNEAFEKAVREMMSELSPKTLGLLSRSTPITSRNAINTSFSVQDVSGSRRWVFQDVLPGGVGEKAGVHPGDVLLTAAGKPMLPAGDSSAEPPFEMGVTIPITVERAGNAITLNLTTGNPKYKDNPYSDLTALQPRMLNNEIAYLKVSLFPGKIGIDFANELDKIFNEQFRAATGLLLDLRGNPGGGIGGLTLMSYLTPSRLPIGYSRNRELARKGVHPSTLPVFDRIPRSKLGIPGLALKFLNKTSIFLYTEAQGQNAFRGPVVILVNEHTAGAAEMLTQFAKENGLAKIVGTKTPGRLVSRSATKLGCGYRLIVPVAAYVSAKGTQIEGTGIVPDKVVPWVLDDVVKGIDNQLAAALEQF